MLADINDKGPQLVRIRKNEVLTALAAEARLRELVGDRIAFVAAGARPKRHTHIGYLAVRMADHEGDKVTRLKTLSSPRQRIRAVTIRDGEKK